MHDFVRPRNAHGIDVECEECGNYRNHPAHSPEHDRATYPPRQRLTAFDLDMLLSAPQSNGVRS